MTSSLLAGRALDAQVDLLRFTQSPTGRRLAEAMADLPQHGFNLVTELDRDIQRRHPGAKLENLATAFYDGQVFPLAYGETFAVSAEISDLINAGGLAQDLIRRTGVAR